MIFGVFMAKHILAGNHLPATVAAGPKSTFPTLYPTLLTCRLGTEPGAEGDEEITAIKRTATGLRQRQRKEDKNT